MSKIFIKKNAEEESFNYYNQLIQEKLEEGFHHNLYESKEKAFLDDMPKKLYIEIICDEDIQGKVSILATIEFKIISNIDNKYLYILVKKDYPPTAWKLINSLPLVR